MSRPNFSTWPNFSTLTPFRCKGRLADRAGRAYDGSLSFDVAAEWEQSGRAEVVPVAQGDKALVRIVTTQPSFACMPGGRDGRTPFVITAPDSGRNRTQGRDRARACGFALRRATLMG
ncbi:MAG TPA: hypothetical protein VEV17_24465 [Bryobacteraceae bacterium]|nr:hypothetical protein [Bryobacteraceae bacterium]